MKEKIIISGFGGQGVLTAGLILAEAAVLQGLEATFIPSYGAEMRGGTANCNVKIQTEKIATPVIERPNNLIALNEPSIDKFLPKMTEDAFILLNGDRIKKKFEKGNRIVKQAEMDTLANEQIHDLRAVNMIALGIFIHHKPILKPEMVKQAIQEKFQSKGSKVVDMNIKAFDFGLGLRI